jgi:hypothetical protein
MGTSSDIVMHGKYYIRCHFAYPLYVYSRPFLKWADVEAQRDEYQVLIDDILEQRRASSRTMASLEDAAIACILSVLRNASLTESQGHRGFTKKVSCYSSIRVLGISVFETSSYSYGMFLFSMEIM